MQRDLGVTDALRSLRPTWGVDVFGAISLLGDLVIIVPLLAVLYLADVWGTLRRHTGSRAAGGPLCSDRTAFLVAVVFGGLALVVLLESIFSLSRTPESWHAIEASEFGFPSGHTMAATVLWGALATWGTFGRRSVRVALAAAIVGLVGLSRLVLGVHYLVDVLAAVGFGVVYLAAVVWLTRGRPERAFGIAIAIAVGAVLVTGASSRGVLALGGTVGAAIGWRLVELPPIRRRIVRVVAREP